MSDKDQLPYFRIKQKPLSFTLFRLLKWQFIPSLRKRFSYHYLVLQNPRLYLKFIQETLKNYPYFLRFDINKYFPSINHSILLSVIDSNYQMLTKKPISRRFKRILKKDLPCYLQCSPFLNYGLAIGSPLSHILGGIYLLKLDLSLPVPFLRFTDDYLLFCKNEKQAEELLKNIINPRLSELKLSINTLKLNSGKFHQDKVNFLGFEFDKGYIRISKDKVENFKLKIKKLTYLTQNKSTEVIIKQLNRQILGFGHYYKLAQTKEVFEDLDSFIRLRLRRYITKNKNIKNYQGNFILTNQLLKELKLKSLVEIYESYAVKRNKKKKKYVKIRVKTGQRKFSNFSLITETLLQYRQNEILCELKKLTTLIIKMQKKLNKHHY